MAGHEHDLERRGVGEEEDVNLEADPYLEGFLAGLAAAKGNSTSNTTFPCTSSLFPEDDSSTGTLWPFQDGFTQAPPPSVIPWPQSLSLAQNIFPYHESPDKQNALPSSTVDNNLFNIKNSTATAYPPQLDEHRWSPASYGAANTLDTPSSFVLEGDIPPNWLLSSDLSASQHDQSTLSEPQVFPAEPSENRNVPPSQSATNKAQAWNIPESQQSSTSIDTPPSRGTPDGEALKTLLPYVARRVKRPKTLAHSSSPSVTKQATQGAIQMVFRAYGSQRSKLDEQSRVRTAITRAVGACATCRKKKLRCDQSSKDDFVPCDRCARLPSHLLSGPCCRVEIIDIKLFRLGSTAAPATLQQWMMSKEFEKGALVLQNGTTIFEAPQRVYLTQEINLTTFAVTVSRFQPGPDDTIAYTWIDSNGTKREYAMPPYYITDMAEAGENMRQYARVARPEFTKALLVNVNPIVRKTFEEAERYYTVSKSNLVAAALMFWSATRMIERFWLICGANTLGMPPMVENLGFCRRSPYFDAIPVTPVMDTQLDELAIKDVLIPLKINLLRLLKARVLAKKKENWYEIYLTCFIILHNSERVNEHILDFCRRFGVEPQPKSNDEASLSHAYFHGCKTILAYFHFASGGAAPLSLNWDTANQDTSGMTEEQISYLRALKAEVCSQASQLQLIKDTSMYESEMYWCHQMLFPDWKSDIQHMGKLLEFTEKDFLIA